MSVDPNLGQKVMLSLLAFVLEIVSFAPSKCVGLLTSFSRLFEYSFLRKSWFSNTFGIGCNHFVVHNRYRPIPCIIKVGLY